VTGKGITATVDGQRVLVGNEPLFAKLGVPVAPAALERLTALREDGKTAMLVGTDAGVAGVVAVADPLRPDAIQSVRHLHELGVTRIVMLSGDNQRVADAIAHRVGIDEARADLLPADKVAAIEALKREGKVVMVGDGVNDAPALATADLGIAMGGGGSDVALETSDIVLMNDDLTKLPYTIGLSRRARSIIRGNIGFALAVIITMVTLTLTIGVPLPLGVVMHEGSTIVVTLNGLRLLAGHPHRPTFKEAPVRQPVPVAG
jgi:Zn2+/Cd2+-exporting ATPase